ncbi:hypothetical protein B0H63DRAFT_485994 [Podospora didyma]|uniref:Secreted protein n=1 Tax=Podospora didyma TaxID=330526 RepID=A0AAE0K5K1_9PEZI|nr:hypothetical protein B0H63DRAFT_485994 [Podospora didyma]
MHGCFCLLPMLAMLLSVPMLCVVALDPPESCLALCTAVSLTLASQLVSSPESRPNSQLLLRSTQCVGEGFQRHLLVSAWKLRLFWRVLDWLSPLGSGNWKKTRAAFVRLLGEPGARQLMRRRKMAQGSLATTAMLPAS